MTKQTVCNISQILTFIITLVFSAIICLGADTDNVRIVDERISYTVQPSGKVKMVEQTTYEASRADDRVVATAMFNEDISIDKATAPGATPVYRPWEDGDLFYTGSRICMMDVPLKKGKPAKVTFEQTYRAPEQFCNVFLTAPYSTDQSLITVEVPATLADRYKVRPMNLESNMTFEKSEGKNGSIIYSVKAVDRKPFRYEPEAPSASVSAPQLIITGMFSNVDELYGFFRKYCPENADATGSISNLSKEITKGCSSDLQKIDSIASWVRQNIRYVAVEHGEYGIRPEPAADVLSKRYGDCKGSTSLIKALLNEAGIDGRLVWIGTAGEVATRWDSVPSLMSGNHQIAAAVLPDTIIYIDGTTTWAPAGYISPSLRGQQALIEDGDNYMLRIVPDEGIHADTDSLTARFAIVDGNLCGTVAHRLGGVYKMSLAGAYHMTDPAKRKTLLSRILSHPKKNTSCPDPRLELESPSAETCRIVCDNFTDNGAARSMGDKLIVDLRPIRARQLSPVDLNNRCRGVEFPFGYNYAANITLDIPEGYEVESLPARQDFDSPWFRGYISYRQDGSTVDCEAYVSTLRTKAELDETAALNAAIKAIIRASESKIILKKIN